MTRRAIRAARKNAAKRSIDELPASDVPDWWDDWPEQDDTTYAVDQVAEHAAMQIPGNY